MPGVRHLQHNVTSGNIWVVVDGTKHVPAFWAHPESGGPFPGLVLLHDDRGLGAHMRAVVHRFAEVGYYVIAPDLFEGQKAMTQEVADVLESRFKSLAPPKVTAALSALVTHHKCNSKMAVVGWDMGAELTLQVALEHEDVMAAVAFYGDPGASFGLFSRLKCPLLVIFGEEDEIARRTQEQLRAELALDKESPHEVVVYPNAAHGFYNDLTSDYREEAAANAWNKTLDFLETHQGVPPTPRATARSPFRPGRVY
jgi:carboxymethylenebutenolidase